MTGTATAPAVQVRKGREGNRWINERPSAGDVVEWFKTIPLHEGMEHDDYIGGITLIQSKEKSDAVVGFDDSGLPQIAERKDLVYIPYARVDSRIAYFWKLMEKHPEWVGVIEPVAPEGGTALGLPPGFFRFSVKGPAASGAPDGVVNYVGCSMRVRILERSTVTFGEEVKRVDDNGRPHLHRVMRGTPIFEYPHASKIVQVVGKYDVDHFSVMKAETGAIGRALGMAGMLVIPGSGVATAEDMQEVPTAAATSPAAAPPAQLPPEQVGESDDDIRAHVARNLTELAKYPEALAQFQEWARGRGLTTLDGLEGANLKGVARKLDRSLHEAKS